MGKMLKPLDKNAIAAWATVQIQVYAKRLGCNTGRIDAATANDLSIQLDNDGQVASEIASILSKHPNIKIMEIRDYPGSYDWASDTYARPCSVVRFAVSHSFPTDKPELMEY